MNFSVDEILLAPKATRPIAVRPVSSGRIRSVGRVRIPLRRGDILSSHRMEARTSGVLWPPDTLPSRGACFEHRRRAAARRSEEPVLRSFACFVAVLRLRWRRRDGTRRNHRAAQERARAGKEARRRAPRTPRPQPARAGVAAAGSLRHVSQGDSPGRRGEPRRHTAQAAGGGPQGHQEWLDEPHRRRRRCASFALYADNMHRHGTPPLSRRYFETLQSTFGHDVEVLTITDPGGRPVSSVLSFYFRDEVLPYYAGDDVVARDLGANDFKYWELMRRACERGIRIFDYGRSKQGTGPSTSRRTGASSRRRSPTSTVFIGATASPRTIRSTRSTAR